MPIKVTFSKTDTNKTKSIHLPRKLIWKESNKSSFENRLDQNLAKIETQTDHESLEKLIKCIVKSYPTPGKNAKQVGKQKWFDNECREARKLSFNLLNKIRDSANVDGRLLSSYSQAKASLKKLFRKKKKEYIQQTARNLATERNPKEYWRQLQILKGQGYKCGVNINGTVLRDHFRKLLNQNTLNMSIQYAEPFVENQILDEDISLDEIIMVVQQAKTGKAAGPDRVPTEFYKNATNQFLRKMCESFNFIFNTGQVPDSFKEALVFPIHKKGDLNDPTNYRGISFTNAIAKMFTAVLLSRITKWVDGNNLLSKYQSGFRSGFSTTDNIFVINTIIQDFRLRQRKLYIFFIDFKAAFDTIDRKALYFKLNQLGISTKMLRIIKELYNGSKSAVWDGTKASEWFETKTGLKQGCLLSAMLFVLFIDDVTSYLPAGINIASTVIKSLLYADDLILLAESPESLQLMINKLKEYCNFWNLIINIDKSKVMIAGYTRGSCSQREKWYYGRENIEVVKSYKYLGIDVTPSFNMKQHLASKLVTTKNAINVSWNLLLKKKEVTNSAKYKVYEVVLRSMMCYGAQVWGFQEYEEVEKLQRFFIKKIFQLPKNTPNYMIHLETGLAALYIYTLKLHVDYIIKVISTYSQERLQHILGLYAIGRNHPFIQKWKDLAESVASPLAINLERPLELKNQMNAIIREIDIKRRENYMKKANESENRLIYPTLVYNLNENNYFTDTNSCRKISLLFRSRGELLNLNGTSFNSAETNCCTLCNQHAREDTFHFIGICPILRNWRIQYFEKPTLTLEELKKLLNGPNWDVIYKYCEAALHYRKLIISEFN